jgi:hypothetical protein
MDGDEDPQSVCYVEDRAAISLNRDSSFGETLRRRGSKSDDKLRTYGPDFVKQPPPTYLDFTCVGALMQQSLTARLEFEMLDRIGQARLRSTPAQPSALSNKRPAGPTNGRAFAVFSISRLLADEHNVGVCRAFSEYSLSRILP